MRTYTPWCLDISPKVLWEEPKQEKEKCRRKDQMNVHDKAYDLARAIKESSEYKEMKDIRAKVDADPTSKTMLEDFRKRQSELQQKMMAGEMPPQDEMEHMQKLYEVLALNPNINQLFDAERRLSVVLEDVQRIIAEPLEAMMK
jgi:cell fate (sporulation/competence/biofilm development) regulator YlbF (YheA/YmcA/DUF963 family)